MLDTSERVLYWCSPLQHELPKEYAEIILPKAVLILAKPFIHDAAKLIFMRVQYFICEPEQSQL